MEDPQFSSPSSLEWLSLVFGALGILQTPATLAAAREFWRERLHAKQRAKSIHEQLAELSRRPPAASFGPECAPNASWNRRLAEARVTAVVSGKGGVGKSSIALGLLEYASMFGNVLLVDLDLHNQGLTSMLLGRNASVLADFDTTFGEMQRFRRQIVPSARPNGAKDGEWDCNSISRSQWVALVRRFESVGEGEAERIRALRPFRFPLGKRVQSSLYKATVGSGHSYFLPAREPSQRLFMSDVSRMDFVEVFLFVKALAAWAHDDRSISRIILDCHGAQDMVSVGALLAANHVVVVANEDPGSFEGTAELAAIASQLVRRPDFLASSLSLVVNQSRERWKFRHSAELFQGLIDGVAGKSSEASAGAAKEKPRRMHTVNLPHDDRVRRRLQSYVFPSVVEIPSLWTELSRIAEDREGDPISPGSGGGGFDDAAGPASPPISPSLPSLSSRPASPASAGSRANVPQGRSEGPSGKSKLDR
jgi:hypothetical protein